MNSNTQHTTVNQESINTNVSTEVKHYRKSVLELYQESVENVIGTTGLTTQVSSSGNEFKGLNKSILNDAQRVLGFTSNKWFSKKGMEDNNLIPKSEDDYGVILFSSKLKDIEGSNKKEKIITYYRVFNEDSLEILPI